MKRIGPVLIVLSAFAAGLLLSAMPAFGLSIVGDSSDVGDHSPICTLEEPDSVGDESQVYTCVLSEVLIVPGRVGGGAPLAATGTNLLFLGLALACIGAGLVTLGLSRPEPD